MCRSRSFCGGVGGGGSGVGGGVQVHLTGQSSDTFLYILSGKALIFKDFKVSQEFHHFSCRRKNVFLAISLNMCVGCSKELSKRHFHFTDAFACFLW